MPIFFEVGTDALIIRILCSAFCDFMDVYLATLGGLAKEPQNQEAKAAMRTEIWKLLRSSTEGTFPCRFATQLRPTILRARFLTKGYYDLMCKNRPCPSGSNFQAHLQPGIDVDGGRHFGH